MNLPWLLLLLLLSVAVDEDGNNALFAININSSNKVKSFFFFFSFIMELLVFTPSSSDNISKFFSFHWKHSDFFKACGVCSSAQDFGARISTYGTLETESIKCATSYTFSRDFPKLVSCYQDLGFTDSCAELWAHFAATNGSKCALACFPDATGTTKVCTILVAILL